MNEILDNLLNRENLVLSTVQKRGAAFFIDEILLSFLLMIALYDKFSASSSMEDTINLVNSFVLEFMFVKIIYQSFFIAQYGATLGKMAMKIRVVDIQTGANPNIISSLNRGIFRVISEIFMYLGFLWGFFDQYKQTWHDKTARTIVVDS